MDINIFLPQYSFQQKSVITIHSCVPSCGLKKIHSLTTLLSSQGDSHTSFFSPHAPPSPRFPSFFYKRVSPGGPGGAFRILTGLWSGRKRLNHCNNIHSNASNASFFFSFPLFPATAWDVISLLFSLFTSLLASHGVFWQRCLIASWWFSTVIIYWLCSASLSQTIRHPHEGSEAYIVVSPCYKRLKLKSYPCEYLGNF